MNALPRTAFARPVRTALVSLVAIGLLAGCTAAPAATGTDAPPAPTTTAAVPSEPGAEATTTTPATPESTLSATDASLLYIIEEEKLAHDVYVAMDALYGKNPFTNIIDSETQHQDWLVPTLEARGLDDPRTGVEGTFTDPALQQKYDDFIAKGEGSWAAAIEVGVEIEEMDIIDLQEAIDAETDAATIAAYEQLLAGSENHLAAFQRQQ